MTGPTDKSRIEARLVEVRRLLAERHARIQPDAGFAGRVVARLPRNEAWSFEWAVRRVLPASLAFAMVLLIAVLATGGFARQAAASATASASSHTSSDPLDWLLESRQEVR
jgi:hypothetical protein